MPVRDKVFIDIETAAPKAAGTFKKIAKGAAIAAAAIAVLVKVGKEVIEAFKVQEQAEAKLNATLKATGFAAGLTADELTNMASALQKATTFSDEAIIGGQNLLLTFRNIGEDTFPRATEAMLDMSAAMGTDLKSSAIQLGKALNDPTIGMSALQRVGITFTEQQKETVASMLEMNDIAGAQNVILSELENQFGGVAVAVGETATGAFEKLSNAIGDYKEVSGEKLAGDMQPFIEKITEALDIVNDYEAKLNDLDKAQQIIASGKSAGDLTNELETQLVTIQMMEKSFDGRLGLNRKLVQTEKDFFDILVTEQAQYLANIEATRAQAEAIEDVAKGWDEILELQMASLEGVPEKMLIVLNRRKEEKELLESQTIEYVKIGEMAEKLLETEESRLQDQIDLLKLWSGDGGYQTQIEKAIELLELRKEALNTEDEIITTVAEESEAFDRLYGNINDLISTYNNGLDDTSTKLEDIANKTEIVNDKTLTWESYLQNVFGITGSIQNLQLAMGAIEMQMLEDAGLGAEELAAKKLELAKEQAIQNKDFAVFEALLAVPLAILGGLKAGGPGGGLLAGIAAGIQLAAVIATPIPAAAEGANFETTGPQLMLVGDNPGGRERVSVSPIGSPNINGPGGSTINVILDSEIIYSMVTDGTENGDIRIDRRSFVN